MLAAVNMKVELPGLVASAAGFGLALGPIAAAGGAVAFLVLSAWRTARNKRRKVLKEAPAAAYLLRLEKDLDPVSLVGQVGISVDKLSSLKA
jgi:hypothetical protein